ncbi:hypothetical protein E3U55_10700 [Filobacillus milosensis]|uniref:Putative Flp pilus-assembly TadG-like N-terminal domain-containing protein n=1 Tax=Filobacillus milosensis TaxID=94137 RepID=A0A4Y8IG74_9BACI|nr:Tad domain-containing protein [Filobacillus milosensis]TFB19617.1 hypothetical protein E3U55_10700 [Filobacillus milosensis]
MMKYLMKSEKANATFLVTISFTALLALTGLVVDGGMLYMTHQHLQKAANASVLSGGQELTQEEEVVRQIVDETLEHHDELSSFKGITIVKENRVTLELEKPVETTFMKLFGIDSVDVEVRATARVGPMGRAKGVAPLGIDESIELIYGQEYTLKVDEHDSDTGFFGALAIDGTGASTYKETLINGSLSELKVGDIVDTETGNMAGPTNKAVKTLVDSVCENMYERDCPRVLLIPVYKPYNHDQNQMKQVEITGFAYFYVTEPMDKHNKTVTGVFIERTGTGYELDEAVDRGAFIVRLTE